MYNFGAAAKRYTCFNPTATRHYAFDFETTGLNIRHKDVPFMMSVTFDDGETLLWEAEVDYSNRTAKWQPDDLAEMKAVLTNRSYTAIGSNMKFDALCAERLLGLDGEELLTRCHETIGMHHALRNNESHALKDAAAKHGGIPDDDEAELRLAVKTARIEAAKLGWAVANSATCPQVRRAPKKGWGVMDYALPRALALHYWRTSEAGQAWEAIPKIRRVPAGWDERTASVDDKIAIAFGTWSGIVSIPDPEIAAQQLQFIKQLDGWEWHPPEVSQHKVHTYHTVAAKYCKLDTLRSVTLFNVFKEELEKEKLWDQYMEGRLNTVMAYRIEAHGVSFNTKLAKHTQASFEVDATYTKQVAGYALSPVFPINPGSPTQLRQIFYGESGFNLPVTRLTVNKKNRDKPGQPTTDKDYLADLIGNLARNVPELAVNRIADIMPPTFLPEESMAWRKDMKRWHKGLIADEECGRAKQLYMLCASLLQHGKSTKGISQILGFLSSAVDYDPDTGYATLHPSINPYGTKTTRQSSSNPNGTNISKGGKSKESVAHLFKIKKTLRMLFGPRPGREWWSVDYTQIQLVILAFMSGDDRLIAAVLRGDDFHATVARIIFGHATDPADPRYNDFDPKNNSVHAEQRDLAKNVNFAFVFGAQEAKINLTCGMPGMYDILCDRLPVVVGFLEKMEWEVRRNGYVTTAGGYRLYVPEDKAYCGSVYAIQGTEGEIVKRATYGVQDYLDRRRCDASMYITLPVHDELNFDAEYGYGQRHISPLCQIMEDAAMSFGIPAKVTPKLCTKSWAKGEEWDLKELVV